MTICIVVKKPGLFNDPDIQDIEPGLENMQAIVGGWIECVRIPELARKGIDLWCNEEGKYTCEPNFVYFWPGGPGDTIHGTVFLASHNDEGETVGLTEEQTDFAIAWLNDRLPVVTLERP